MSESSVNDRKDDVKMHNWKDIYRKHFVLDHNQSIRARSKDLVPEADLSAVRAGHHLHQLQHPHVLCPLPQRVLQTPG